MTALPAAFNWEFHSVDPRARAVLSGGTSSRDIYKMVLENMPGGGRAGATLLDVGCGSGALRDYVKPYCERYVGTDLIRYEAFPPDCEFYTADFDLPATSSSRPLRRYCGGGRGHRAC